jgi:hypothetical protein
LEEREELSAREIKRCVVDAPLDAVENLFRHGCTIENKVRSLIIMADYLSR